MAITFMNAKILFGGYDLSGQFNQVTLENSVEALDETAFGSTSRSMKGGLRTGRVTGSGFWRSADGDVDPVFFDSIDLNDAVVLLFPETITEGATATGSGYGLKVSLGKYAPFGAAVGELAPFTIEAEGRGV